MQVDENSVLLSNLKKGQRSINHELSKNNFSRAIKASKLKGDSLILDP